MNIILRKKNILVVGDLILDCHIKVNTERMSREAPIPVFVERNKKYSLGGAGNAALNLSAANQNVFVSGIVGNDAGGRIVNDLLVHYGINKDAVLFSEKTTTIKTRFVSEQNQQVFRVDIEDKNEITIEQENELIKKVIGIIKKMDIVIISDYMEGLVSETISKAIINLANENNISVLVDVRDTNKKKYENAFLLKPNKEELKNLSQMRVSSYDDIIEASRKLKKLCKVKCVLSTCGEMGMVLVDETDEVRVFEANTREVYDVTGAGDTAIAYLAACIANDLSIYDAARISNYAAGLQVEKNGTAVVFVDELKQRIQGLLNADKIIKKQDLHIIRERFKEKRIVFTNGCFDILHIGHVKYLKEASKYGDLLVVGLNSDSSVKRLKGEKRPVNNEIDREEVLCALEYVDYVIVFDEDTPIDLIEELHPDVLVKGGDYGSHKEDIIGSDFVTGYGGCVKLTSFYEGKSTSNIINLIKGKE